MAKRELQEMFCTKLGLELAKYKKKMLSKPPEEIYHKAFQIEGMGNIYEQLLENITEMPEEVLRHLLVFPNLLAYLFIRWRAAEDSYREELQSCIKIETEELSKTYQNIMGREKVVKAA